MISLPCDDSVPIYYYFRFAYNITIIYLQLCPYYTFGMCQSMLWNWHGMQKCHCTKYKRIYIFTHGYFSADILLLPVHACFDRKLKFSPIPSLSQVKLPPHSKFPSLVMIQCRYFTTSTLHQVQTGTWNFNLSYLCSQVIHMGSHLIEKEKKQDGRHLGILKVVPLDSLTPKT